MIKSRETAISMIDKEEAASQPAKVRFKFFTHIEKKVTRTWLGHRRRISEQTTSEQDIN